MSAFKQSLRYVPEVELELNISHQRHGRIIMILQLVSQSPLTNVRSRRHTIVQFTANSQIR